MKKILHIVLMTFFCMITTNCEHTNIDALHLSKTNESTNMFLYIGKEAITTRANETETSFKDLKILVFDENNRFLYSRTAILEGTVPDNLNDVDHFPDNKKNGITEMERFSVQLLSSESPRNIHFISGYKWKGFPQDYFLQGKDAGEIIPQMTTEIGNVVYWQHIKVKSLNENTFKNKVIKLLRNTARISIKKAGDRSLNLLKINRFHIYNQYTKATVAPYTFDEHTYTYSFPSKPTIPTVPFDYEEQTYTYNNNETADVFERFGRDKKDEDNLFVILEATYNNQPCYYKLDLIRFDENGVSKLVDIIRNNWYILTINQVLSKGYTHLNDAITKPASNNIFASLELANFGSISNGQYSMNVTPIGAVIVHPDKFKATITFPNIDDVKVYHEWDENDIYLGNISVSKITENQKEIVIDVKQIPADRTIDYRINVVAKINNSNNYISRQIKLRLRNPYEFNITTNTKTSYNNYSGLFSAKMNLTFTLPSTIPISAYPFDIWIKASGMTPDSKKNKLLIVFKDNEYYYQYTITESVNNVTLYFDKNIYTGNQESTQITVESKIFNDWTQQVQFHPF